MKRWLLVAVFVLDCALTAANYAAQEPAPAPSPQEPQPAAAPAQAAGARGGRGQAIGEPRPYDQVITRDAKTSLGVFSVHRIRERLYYEIPQAEMEKEFLWVTDIAKTALGTGYGGEA